MNQSLLRKVCIANGFVSLIYLALRAYNPHSQAAHGFIKGLLIIVILIGIITTISLCLCAIRGSKQIRKAPPAVSYDFRHVSSSAVSLFYLLCDFLELIGRHVLLLVLVSHFDSVFIILYREYGKAFRIMHRILVTLAVTEIIALSISRFLPDRITSKVKGFVRNGDPVFKLVFYLSFSYLLFYRILSTTMFSWMMDNTYVWAKLMRLSCNLLLLIAVFAAAAEERHLIWALQLSILIIGFLHYRDGGGRQIIWMLCVLIVAAAKKEQKTILWIFVLESAVITLTAYICMRQGILLNLKTSRILDDEQSIARYALGFKSGTDLAARFLYLALAWCVIRPSKSRWWCYIDYFFLFLFYSVASLITHATANSILILTVIFGAFLHQLYINSSHRFSFLTSKKLRFITIPFALSYIVFFVVSCLLSIFYQESSATSQGILSFVPNYKSYLERLKHASEAFRNYRITLLGTVINEEGNGGRLTRPVNYSFLDISYVRILLVGGILITVIVIGSLTFMQIRNAKKNMLFMLFLLFIVSVNCLVEHHLFEYYYDIFPVLLFASSRTEGPEIRLSS